jgi:hypothetical protein
MASDVMTLFNMPTQQQLGQRYLESQMTSPAQMGNQGLLQQVASLGGNAGAIAGYAGGRLFGGATPDQVRARGIEESMMKVQGMGLTSDAEMYSALSKELAARGLTQDAFMANKEARTAMRDEQAIKKGGFDIEKAQVDLQKAKEDMLTLEEQIAQEMSFGNEARVVGLQRQLEAKKRASALVEAQIQNQKDLAKAALINANANASRAGAAAESEKFTIPVYAAGIVPGTRGDIIGRQNKLGQVMGNDGAIYNSVNELNAARGQGQATATPNTTPEKNKPTMSIEERAAQLTAGQGGQTTAAPAVDTARYTRTKNNRGQYVYTYSPRAGKTKAEWAAIE